MRRGAGFRSDRCRPWPPAPAQRSRRANPGLKNQIADQQNEQRDIEAQTTSEIQTERNLRMMEEVVNGHAAMHGCMARRNVKKNTRGLKKECVRKRDAEKGKVRKELLKKVEGVREEGRQAGKEKGRKDGRKNTRGMREERK
jgi:hypothetical protein